VGPFALAFAVHSGCTSGAVHSGGPGDAPVVCVAVCDLGVACAESCNGLDDDCDGVVDDDAAGATWVLPDRDGDGFGDLQAEPIRSCSVEPEWTSVEGDCDDSRADVYPGALGVAGDGVDQDCTGVDEVQCWLDSDADGFGAGSPALVDGSCVPPTVAIDGDCNDGFSDVFPGAAELLDDGRDQDCSGADSVTCFVDGDGDGVGSGPSTVAEAVCPPGASRRGGDCDDVDATINPSQRDVASDGIDQDCSGADRVRCFEDADGDGFGGPVVVPAEGACGAGFAPNGLDCLDSDAATYPGAADVPDDGVDQNCTGFDLVSCYLDIDGDGVSGTFSAYRDGSCRPNESTAAGDCDDRDDSVLPGAVEVVWDGVDQDCDGHDLVACYVDDDRDGYGVGAPTYRSDACPGSAAPEGGDCDDGVVLTYPGAEERCDGVDNDCDPSTPDRGANVGARPYSRLQIAIDAASDGATVSVCPGSYEVNLVISAVDVSLVARDGPGTVELVPDADGPVVAIYDVSATLAGLDIRGGTGEIWGGSTVGGGVYADTRGEVRIEDCRVEGNSATYGGGVLVWDLSEDDTGTLRVARTEISGNSAVGAGGLYTTVNTEFEDVQVFDNTGDLYAGGVFVGAYGASRALTVTVASSIHDNVAIWDGGGLYLWGDVAVAGPLAITGSWAWRGGGVYTYGYPYGYGWGPAAQAQLNGVFVGENAAYEGGGLYLFGDARLVGLTVDGNSASSGGGIAINAGSTSIDGGSVTSNEADEGGGVWLSAWSLSVAGSDFGSGASDNAPSDVGAYGYTYDAASDTFACDFWGCSP
jgi:hypothetical protein